MKKIIKSLILLLILSFPICAFAQEGIDNYYIDATVLENGDVNVKELFVLNGEYNGYERIINYKNSNAVSFTGKDSDLNGSSIYNGDAIVINEVKGIEIDGTLNFSNLNDEGKIFEKSSDSYSGDYGKYTETTTSDGVKIKIYNPSSYNNGFYINYTIKNMAICHNDIAELGFNIFSNQQIEYINQLEMILHIPNNETELRAWGHGPLNGKTENLDKQTVKLTIGKIDPNTAIDIRAVFDKNVISQSNKKTDIDALKKIVNLETIKADEANKQRELIRTKIKLIMISSIVLDCIIFLVLIYLVINTYKKYDKEYESEFRMQYFRDIPSHIEPTSLGYLLNHSIGNNDLSASILKLINEGVITCEDKKTLVLVNKNNVSKIDEQLISWIFDSKDSVTFDELKINAKKNYDIFLNGYTLWHGLCEKEAISKNYYENITSAKTLGVVISLTGLVTSVFLSFLNCETMFFPFSLIFPLLEIGTLIYFATIKKRTKIANDEYKKWIALKKFMVDFGNFSEKELPEVHLWNEYLVYAISLGCADKLAKTMKLKLQEMEQTDTVVTQNLNTTFNNLYIANFVNNQINSLVTTAKSSKQEAEIASSSNSSGGGFGGGFSSGGGSFGGGGGGGRF